MAARVCAVGGHEDDEQLGVGGADAAQGFKSIHAAHAHVHEHEVGLEFGDDFQSLFTAGRGGNSILKRIALRWNEYLTPSFIINQQELAHLRA